MHGKNNGTDRFKNRRRGMRARTEAKRQDILRVAGDMFLTEGYGAVSMNRIAAALGGSKATLYGYFPSKEALFAAYVIHNGGERLAEIPGDGFDLSDLPGVLAQIGRRYLSLVLTPSVLALNRMVIGESPRFPELGQLFFENGPRRTVNHMSAIFQQLAALHALPVLAQRRSALQFKSLCDAGLYDRHLWGIAAPATDDEIDAAVEVAVGFFLRGCAAAGR
jgi:TetR/AcrR family transcriptional repressor of mexJK operon